MSADINATSRLLTDQNQSNMYSWSVSQLTVALGLAGGLGVSAASTKRWTPLMGWNSYNKYNCNPTEAIIKENAKGLVDLGLGKLGYTYVTPDCGWMTSTRDVSTSQLVWDSKLFPSGGKALGDYIHGLGLDFGLYSGAGYFQCGSENPKLPASLGEWAFWVLNSGLLGLGLHPIYY